MARFVPEPFRIKTGVRIVYETRFLRHFTARFELVEPSA
jgi:tryptophanase